MNRVVVSAFILGLGVLLGVAGGCAAAGPVRIMSVPLAGTGDTSALNEIAKAARSQRPDVVAVQGADSAAVHKLRAALPGYGYVGAGSVDGGERGEFVPIFYREARFAHVAHGHFWLSEHPEQVGSAAWGAAGPRVASWVRLSFRDGLLDDLQLVNVRFDRQSERARLESARLIRKLADSAGGRPLVVLGDFACDRGSAPYRVLTEDRRNLAELRDAAACGAGEADGPAEYVRMKGRGSTGRAHWILFNRGFEPIGTEEFAQAGGGRSAALMLTLRRAGSGYT